MRNLSNGETFETGMVNWKTRVYKIFLFARPQTICTLRYRVLWGFMLRHRRGEFHSTKVLFSPRTASLCPATRVHRNEKRFPRFRLQLLCFVEFHSIFLNKYFFFFVFWWKNKPDPIQQHWVALYTVKNEIGRAREADAESFFFWALLCAFRYEKKL